MPAARQIDPTSRRSRLRLYFATNPGNHRAKDVAAAIGEPTQYVANECSRLAREGALTRLRIKPPKGATRVTPITVFSVPQPTQEK